MSYAEGTRVPAERSKAELDRLLAPCAACGAEESVGALERGEAGDGWRRANLRVGDEDVCVYTCSEVCRGRIWSRCSERTGESRLALPGASVLSPRRGIFLTAGDVARLCGVDLKTIHNWVRRGRIRHFRTPGGHRRFRRADVTEFLRRSGYAVPEYLIADEVRESLDAWQLDVDAPGEEGSS